MDPVLHRICAFIARLQRYAIVLFPFLRLRKAFALADC
jgi:hypothetical protein